jgi:hypothetical protein
MNKYQPNLADPRVMRKVQHSLEWVNTYLSANNDSWLSTREIQRQLGSQSRPLGKWLKTKLLICSNNYYNPLNHVCKTYKLNLTGYLDLCHQTGHQPKFKLSQQIEQQLVSGEFEYTTKSNRDFNPVQFMPKERRRNVLENYGYRFHYDIEAAAATLLLQQARQCQQTELSTPRPLTSLEHYIQNRAEVRQQIANECHTDSKTVKLVINAVLQGAHLSRNGYSVILKDLNWNYDLVLRLQNSQTLKDIRGDIREMWQILKTQIPQRYVTDKNGKVRKQPLSGRDKSGFYRILEEQVAGVIRGHLKRNKIRHLWIHDGWSCEKIVDDLELVSEVRRQTGFVIKLDREVFDQ